MSSQQEKARSNKVIRLELLIEEYGIAGALGLFIRALENLQEERLESNSNYLDTKEYENYERDIEVLGLVCDAVDVDHKNINTKLRESDSEQLTAGLNKLKVKEA